LGVGAGGFSTALFRLAPDVIADYTLFQPVHRVPVLLRTELGPVAPLAWWMLTIGPSAALLFTPVGERCSSWLAALTASLGAVCVLGWWEAYPWSSQQGMLLTWLFLGAWVGEYTEVARSCRI